MRGGGGRSGAAAFSRRPARLTRLSDPDGLVGHDGGEDGGQRHGGDERRGAPAQAPQQQRAHADDADLEHGRGQRALAQEVGHHAVGLGGKAQPQRVAGEQQIGGVQHPELEQQPEQKLLADDAETRERARRELGGALGDDASGRRCGGHLHVAERGVVAAASRSSRQPRDADPRARAAADPPGDPVAADHHGLDADRARGRSGTPRRRPGARPMTTSPPPVGGGLRPDDRRAVEGGRRPGRGRQRSGGPARVRRS